MKKLSLKEIGIKNFITEMNRSVCPNDWTDAQKYGGCLLKFFFNAEN